MSLTITTTCEILKLLIENQGLTTYSLSRLTNTHVRKVQRYCKSLADQGFIQAKKDGNHYQYFANINFIQTND